MNSTRPESMDPDTFFDQQASTLFGKTQVVPQTPGRISELGNTSSNVVDNLGSRVSSIEERLNASDSLYRLATQTMSAREKERRSQISSISAYAQSLNDRVIQAEEKMKVIPDTIKSLIKEEIAKRDTTPQFQAKINEINSQFNKKISTLEKVFEENTKRTQKALKKLKVDLQLIQTQPQDDSRVEELNMQIAEMKRRQSLMFELINAMRSQNDQDFESVNTQVNGLFSQLASKRSLSPRHL